MLFTAALKKLIATFKKRSGTAWNHLDECVKKANKKKDERALMHAVVEWFRSQEYRWNTLLVEHERAKTIGAKKPNTDDLVFMMYLERLLQLYGYVHQLKCKSISSDVILNATKKESVDWVILGVAITVVVTSLSIMLPLSLTHTTSGGYAFLAGLVLGLIIAAVVGRSIDNHQKKCKATSSAQLSTCKQHCSNAKDVDGLLKTL